MIVRGWFGGVDALPLTAASVNLRDRPDRMVPDRETMMTGQQKSAPKRRRINIEDLMLEPDDGPGLSGPCVPDARAGSGSMSGGYIICHLPITSNPIVLEVYGLRHAEDKVFLCCHERFTQHIEEQRINIAKTKPEPRRAPARIEDTLT